MSRKIALTQGLFATVDDADYEWLSQWKWYARKSGRTFYAARMAPSENDKRRLIHMHRLILGTPIGKETDHVNRDGLDNRCANLRICTKGQNSMNRKKRAGCTSKYLGVSWCKDCNKWGAEIQHDGTRHRLGHFTNERDAARAYNAAATTYHGLFANPNVTGKND